MTELGDAVTGIQVGQRVIAAPMAYGCFADRMLAPAAGSLPVPDDMPDSAAAALFSAYQTSWVGLVRRAALRAGDTLLVHGAAGGVGSAAVQIGKALGARVIAVAGGSEKVAACTALGADLVVDHRRDDPVAAVRAFTDGRGVDVAYDPVGGSAFDVSRKVIAVEGRILVVGFAGGSIPTLAVNHALLKNYSVVGFRLQPFREDPEYLRRVHGELVTLHAAGMIAPLVSQQLPLSEAAAAVARLGERGVLGRIVLTA
ncbi:Quinone oxidoreductase 1 [Tsukamurella ocularis]